ERHLRIQGGYSRRPDGPRQVRQHQGVVPGVVAGGVEAEVEHLRLVAAADLVQQADERREAADRRFRGRQQLAEELVDLVEVAVERGDGLARADLGGGEPQVEVDVGVGRDQQV